MNRIHLVGILACAREYEMADMPLYDVYDFVKEVAESNGESVEHFIEGYIKGAISLLLCEHDFGFNCVEFEKKLGNELIDQLGAAYVELEGFLGEMLMSNDSPWEIIREYDL